MSLLHHGLAVVIIIVWGLNIVMIKMGLEELPPLLLNTLRFSLLGLLLAPWFRPRVRQLPWLLLISVVFIPGHFGVLFFGLRGVDAASAAIALQMTVPFGLIVSWLFFRDRPTPVQVVGMVLAFCGVVLLAGEPERAPPQYLAIIACATFTFALAAALAKRVGRMHPLTYIGWTALLGAPQVAVLTAVVDSNHLEAISSAGWAGWGAVLYTAIPASMFAHSSWYFLIRRYSINRVMVYSMTVPFSGAVFGIWILAEPITVYKVAGGLVSVAGVAMVQFLSRQKARSEMADDEATGTAEAPETPAAAPAAEMPAAAPAGAPTRRGA